MSFQRCWNLEHNCRCAFCKLISLLYTSVFAEFKTEAGHLLSLRKPPVLCRFGSGFGFRVQLGMGMNITSCETGSLCDIISSANDVMTLLNHKTVCVRLKTLIVHQIQLSLLSLCLFTTLSVYQEFLHLSRTQITTKEDFWNFLFSFLITNVLPLFPLPGRNRAEKKLEWGSEGRRYRKHQWMCYAVKEDQSAGPKRGGQIKDLEERTCRVLVFFFKKYGVLLLK